LRAEPVAVGRGHQPHASRATISSTVGGSAGYCSPCSGAGGLGGNPGNGRRRPTVASKRPAERFHESSLQGVVDDPLLLHLAASSQRSPYQPKATEHHLLSAQSRKRMRQARGTSGGERRSVAPLRRWLTRRAGGIAGHTIDTTHDDQARRRRRGLRVVPVRTGRLRSRERGCGRCDIAFHGAPLALIAWADHPKGDGGGGGRVRRYGSTRYHAETVTSTATPVLRGRDYRPTDWCEGPEMRCGSGTLYSRSRMRSRRAPVGHLPRRRRPRPR